jgi:hypothetical protein
MPACALPAAQARQRHRGDGQHPEGEEDARHLVPQHGGHDDRVDDVHGHRDGRHPQHCLELARPEGRRLGVVLAVEHPEEAPHGSERGAVAAAADAGARSAVASGRSSMIARP